MKYKVEEIIKKLEERIKQIEDSYDVWGDVHREDIPNIKIAIEFLKKLESERVI